MDRKNKKAAQVAAGASGGKDGGRGGKNQRRENQSAVASGGSPSTSGSSMRNPLLSGSTAPTRALPASSRPPLSMPLKATISPSAPAPLLQDTDFASFALRDESNKHSVAPAQGKSSQSPFPLVKPDATAADQVVGVVENRASPAPSPLPPSTPSAPRRFGVNQPRSPDFGPIGSPPRSISSTGQATRMNGFSPSTPPSHNTGFVSSSPFSAPGPNSVLITYKEDSPSDVEGLAASLGRSWITWNTVPSKIKNRVDFDSKLIAEEDVVEDGDLEDFLPNTLTDLLTPEERTRRMSRSNSGQPMAVAKRDSSLQRTNTDVSHHRYSRSVPANSLLGDLRSIWSDNHATSNEPIPPSGGLPFSATGGLGSGTPGSFKSNTGFGSQPINEDALSPPILSPTNASAAFLPGLHHHYLNSKTGAQRSTATNPRTAGPSFHSTSTGAATPNTPSTHAYVPAGSTGMALSPPQQNHFGNRPRFDGAMPDSFVTPTSNRQVPIPGGNSEFGGDVDERRNALSPSTRALQAHAPGQSLPQGLAAGYSRIHALPPPPMISSPPGTGAFSTGQAVPFSSSGTNGHELAGTADYSSTMQGMGAPSQNAGLDSMFTRLSYPVSAPRIPSSTSPGMSATASARHVQMSPAVTAPGMVRNASGRSWQSQGPFSPLSGRVVTGDDDELFIMDG